MNDEEKQGEANGGDTSAETEPFVAMGDYRGELQELGSMLLAVGERVLVYLHTEGPGGSTNRYPQ